MKALSLTLGVLFLAQGFLGLDWVPLSIVANRLPPVAFFALPILLLSLSFLAVMFLPIYTILRHGRRVPTGAPPTPGYSRARLLGIFYYDLEPGYFRSVAVAFFNQSLLVCWWVSSMTFSGIACGLMIEAGRLHNGGPELLQAMLTFFLGFAFILLPLLWWARRSATALIDRIIQRARS